MNKSDTNEVIESLKIFRQDLYDSFPGRADANMDLLDSLSANQTARSVVELSLNEPFQREYSSVFDAIEHAALIEKTQADDAQREAQREALREAQREALREARREAQKIRTKIISTHLPAPVQRPFWLFGVDATPNPRPFAPTLSDRSIVYQPNPAPGNKPIAVGHSYSILAALPERGPHDPPWVVPLDCRRVASSQKATAVAAEQIKALLTDDALPFVRELTVEVADSGYCHAKYLHEMGGLTNHVVIARSPNNRVFYRQPIPPTTPARGHPTWYGEPFRLADPTT